MRYAWNIPLVEEILECLPVLLDPKLLFISAIAGLVTMVTIKTIASRPAALATRCVAMSITIYNLFFLISRFANLFYLPLLARYVDRAVATENLSCLLLQIRVVIWGMVVGALIAWLLLPTFVEIFIQGIRAIEKYQSLPTVLLKIALPRNWYRILRCLRPPSNLGVRLWNLEGLPLGFLLFNVLATAIWTVGVLCAAYVSAIYPDYARTSLLLSGLVNAVAAILFSVVVDPKAALITDQAIAGARPEKQVYAAAVFLSASNFLGTLLGQLLLEPGISAIRWATVSLVQGMKAAEGGLIPVVAISAIVTLMSSTTYASRVSAVITRRVATAIAIYNFFFLVTRLAGQVYSPAVGSIVDITLQQSNSSVLEGRLRLIILGSTLGAAVGLLLLPTFVEIYRKAILGMEKFGSLPRLLLASILPSFWRHWWSCLRPPSLLGIRFEQVAQIPRNFLIYNVLVISIHTIGIMSAVYASALHPHISRTTTLLSSVVNGVASILLGLVVDPVAALLTDNAVSGKRPENHIKVMAVFLMMGMLLGTLLSQVIFRPCVWFIGWCSELVARIF